MLFGGKPIAAVDGPNGVTEDTEATRLVEYAGTILFESAMLHLKSLISNIDTVEASRFEAVMLLGKQRNSRGRYLRPGKGR